VPESLLTRVKALPEVAAAGGTMAIDESNKAEIVGRNGKPAGSGNAPRLALGNDTSQPQFSPLKLSAGEWGQGPKQVVIDAATAEKERYAVGDSIVVSTLGDKHRYELTGIATFGDVDSLGGATLAVFDIDTAQTLLHKEGEFDGISIAAKDGTSSAALMQAVQPLVPASLELKDAKAQAEADSAEINEALGFIRYFLLGFGGIALFVGAFVIFNTLSITVAQRTREFATLRTLGGSRKQVMRSVIIEGFVIGLLASIVGLFAGVGIAKGLNALIGADIPEAGTVLGVRTVVVSLVLGVTITLVASIMPARRATRVPPIAAVREGSTLPPSRFAAHSLKAAIAVIAASVVAICAGVFASGLSVIGVAVLLGGGIIALFLGVALAAPHLVKPLTRVVGWPASRAGVAGELAGANSTRNPGRTASTAAALMIGLTLVTVVAVLGAGLRTTVESAVTDQVSAAFIIDGKDGAPFEAAEGNTLARTPGVTTASHVRTDVALVGGEERDVTGVDPATIAQFYTFAWTKGSDDTVAQLGQDGALVTKTYADDKNVAVGKRLSIKTASGDKRTVVVAGIYDPPDIEQMLGDVTISQAAFDASFPQPKNLFTFIDAPPEASADLAAVAGGFSDATFHTGQAFAKDYTEGFASFLKMLYVLLAFSVVASFFEMINTLVL